MQDSKRAKSSVKKFQDNPGWIASQIRIVPRWRISNLAYRKKNFFESNSSKMWPSDPKQYRHKCHIFHIEVTDGFRAQQGITENLKIGHNDS